MKASLLIIILFGSLSAMSQDFAIKRVEISGGIVNVYYDLLDSTSQRTYTIKVFSSKDNFISPLKKYPVTSA